MFGADQTAVLVLDIRVRAVQVLQFLFRHTGDMTCSVSKIHIY